MIEIIGNYQIDKLGILGFADCTSDTDMTVYNIEDSFIKDLKIMGFLEFVRMSHVLKVVHPYDSVLDIGCAYGHYGYSLYTNRYSIQYYGIDVCLKHLEKAVSRKWGNSKPVFINKNAVNGLPFLDESFNSILLIQVIEHLGIDNALILLSQIKRVLKRKGTVVLTTENSKFTENGGLDFHLHEFGYKELVDLVKESGFIIKNEYGLLHSNSVRNLPKTKQVVF